MPIAHDSSSIWKGLFASEETDSDKRVPKPESRPVERHSGTDQDSTIDWSPARRQTGEEELESGTTWHRPMVDIIGRGAGLDEPEWGIDPKGRLRFLPSRRFAITISNPTHDDDNLPVVTSTMPSTVSGKYHRYLARQKNSRHIAALFSSHAMCIMLLSAMASWLVG